MTDDSDRSNRSLLSLNISDVFGIGKAAKQLNPAATKILEGLSETLRPASLYLEQRALGAANRHEMTKNLQQLSVIDAYLASNPEFATEMKSRLLATEIRRQENIHRSSQKALLMAQEHEKCENPTDIDSDFLQHWLEGVKDISNTQVQDIWASLLATAPRMPEGRVSRPAVELLKQFDQPTAQCFMEFLKVWAAVGLPSSKAPTNWAPFGTPIRFKLLEELGVIEQRTLSAQKLPNLGWIKQLEESQKPFLNTMNVFVLRQRAMELADAIFQDPLQIDDEKVESARSENLKWITDDDFWSVGLYSELEDREQDDFWCVISPQKDAHNQIEETLMALQQSLVIDAAWKPVLAPYAKSGRLRFPSA